MYKAKLPESLIDYLNNYQSIGVVLVARTNTKPAIIVKHCHFSNNQLEVYNTCTYEYDYWKVPREQIDKELSKSDRLIIESRQAFKYLCSSHILSRYDSPLMLDELAPHCQFLTGNMKHYRVIPYDIFNSKKEISIEDLSNRATHTIEILNSMLRYLELEQQYPIIKQSVALNISIELLQNDQQFCAVSIIKNKECLNEPNLLVDYYTPDNQLISEQFNIRSPKEVRGFFDLISSFDAIIMVGNQTEKICSSLRTEYERDFMCPVFNLFDIADQIFGKVFSGNDHTLNLRFMTSIYGPDKFYDWPKKYGSLSNRINYLALFIIMTIAYRSAKNQGKLQ